jgi:hypothetical protein
VVSFPQVSPSKPCIRLSSPPYALHVHLILFDFVTRTILVVQYRSFSSSLCSSLHSPVTSSLQRPNILLSTLFSNTLSQRSSLNVSDQVSHPYKTRGRIIVRYMKPYLNCSLNVHSLDADTFTFHCNKSTKYLKLIF